MYGASLLRGFFVGVGLGDRLSETRCSPDQELLS